MNISIKDFLVQTKTTLELFYEYPILSKSIEGRTFRFLEHPTLRGSLRKIDGRVYGDFLITIDLLENCSRCLEETKTKYDFAVQGYIVDEESEDEDQEEIILSLDGVLEAEHILDIALLDSLSYKVLCQEHCKGLCMSCGANLNKTPCSCKNDNLLVDSRLACLKKLMQ